MFNLIHTIMKRTLLSSVLFSSILMSTIFLSLSANAQKKVYLNTFSGTNIERYDGQTLNIYTSRQIFNGWNTICLPFSMTADEVNAAFGSDCKLETLTEVNADGAMVVMNFTDIKNKGIQAGYPYLLWFSGETKVISIDLQNKEMTSTIKPVAINGITFTGTQTHIEAAGHYGILARDNKDAQFVATDNTLSGFYATRCYIDYAGSTSTLITVHNQTPTAIKSITLSDVNGDIYNLNGQKVNQAQQGINIINGKKVLVK